MQKVAALSFSLAAAVVAACSSSSSSSSDACGGLYDALNSYAQACGQSTGKAADKGRFITACQFSLAAPGSNTSSIACTCTSAYKGAASSCDTTSAATACEAGPGTLADGAACGASEQCKSTRCKPDTTGTTTDTGCGKCVATIVIGGACDAAKGDVCVSGAGCKTSGTATTGTCASFTSSTLAEGAACGDVTTGAYCGTGLRCDATTKKCAKQAATGEACTLSSDCQRTLSCFSQKCGPQHQIGDTCTGSSDCVTNAACDATAKKCVAITYGAPGDACGTSGKDCAKGSCIISGTGGTGSLTGKCPTIIADGQACDPKSTDARCDEQAKCIQGKCAIFDPASCK